jgi:hypothetical protein
VCTGTLTQVNGLQSNKKRYFKLGGSFPSYSIMPNQQKKLSYIGLDSINCTENCNGCKKLIMIYFIISYWKIKVRLSLSMP